MEVAVIQFTTLRSAGLLTVLGVSLAAAGCADNVTYSKDSRRQGITMYQKEDYANAAGAFRSSVRQNPRDYRSYYWLGQSYEQMEQYQQSIQAYKTGRDVIGQTTDGREDVEMRYKLHNGLASAIAKSDASNVETDWAEGQARSRQTADDWYLVAKIFVNRGDPDSALEAFQRAVKVDPNNFVINKEAGLYLEQLGQTQQALAPLRRAYVLEPQDQEVIAALRRIGIVPGPGLKQEGELVRPEIPRGPIPEWDWNKLTGSKSQTNVPAPQGAAPRD